MADILQQGAAWLQQKLKAVATQQVTYKRGAESLPLDATLGKDLLKLGDEVGGVRMVWTDADIIITAADLVLGGGPTRPARGDVVLIQFGTVTKRFEVFAEDGEPPWRWADQYQLMIRIHLKYMGNV